MSHICVCVYIYICRYMYIRMYISYTCIRIYVYIYKLLVPVLKRAPPDSFKRQATSFRANPFFHLSGSVWWERNKELWTKTCNHSGYKPTRRTNFATKMRCFIETRNCAAALYLQVTEPKPCTDLDPTLFYLLISGIYRKFAREH